MTPGDRASCLGTSSPHALSQRLLEYSRSKDFKQVLTGLSGWFQRYLKVTYGTVKLPNLVCRRTTPSSNR
jgi:hypothetical protein